MPADTRPRYAVYSRGIASITGLSAALGAELVWRPRDREGIGAVIAWGRRPSSLVAEKAASTFEVPLIRLEDGFLRSVRPGGNRPLSIIQDGIGIYYDAVRPSGLEEILMGSDAALARPAVLERAKRGMERVRTAGLSKYNAGSSLWPRSLEISGETPIALVADQTAGDLSVQLGLGPEDFTPLVERALDECPRALVVVKLHPEVARGTKRGHTRLHAKALQDARVRILTEDVQPSVLFERAERVYVGTSQLGFDALMAGCKVTCAGVPFYAGWGLTTDLQTAPRRGVRRSLEELAAASWLLYSRYIDPVRRERCEFEDVVEHLALQREMFERNRGSLVAYGFSAWKRPILAAYLSGPDTTLRFEKDRAPESPSLPFNERSVVWGSREAPRTNGAAVWRIEDGFLRSVGLGSDLSAPASLVVDDQGIYYDARTPSALEQILAGAQFSADELDRARRLRQQIVSTALSKYNLQPHRQLSLAAVDRRIALVIGQVDGDQSLLYGSAVVQDTAALLERVRAEQPDSFLLFKPHPDVLSGNRAGLSSSPLADLTVADASVASCLDVAHEVFTMTSLVGFEALLREIPVTCYGQPFYSGWGLTRDREPHPRRTRRLTLDELVAGVLLRYPRYYSFRAEAFVRPEDALGELALAQLETKPLALGVPRWLRRWTRLLRYLGGRLGA